MKNSDDAIGNRTRDRPACSRATGAPLFDFFFFANATTCPLRLRGVTVQVRKRGMFILEIGK